MGGSAGDNTSKCNCLKMESLTLLTAGEFWNEFFPAFLVAGGWEVSFLADLNGSVIAEADCIRGCDNANCTRIATVIEALKMKK